MSLVKKQGKKGHYFERKRFVSTQYGVYTYCKIHHFVKKKTKDISENIIYTLARRLVPFVFPGSFL